ncbi:hypothetical protein ACPOL_4350 [Acidisarcina polymorpha]|uniref:Uncharacterized protein n=1 Tax=Acidisarcina polymorpha TaxID=2211140 RepID=A0A2Z5G4M8_9BACT|nr:hypothetical protein ACPOL_4350 [Acidisarcina polymorpha]
MLLQRKEYGTGNFESFQKLLSYFTGNIEGFKTRGFANHYACPAA